MSDWKILALALAFVAYMAQLKTVNRRAMRFAGLLVLALAGYKTVPMLAAGLASQAGPEQYSGVEAIGPGSTGPGFGGVLSIFRRGGGGTPPAGAPGVPNTPSLTVVVIDTSTVYALGSAFAGSGADTQDSVRFAVTRLAADTTAILSEVKTGAAQQRDTIADQANLKADTTYRGWLKYHGVAGGWSAWSPPDTFVNTPVVLEAAWNWSSGTGTSSGVLRDSTKSVPWQTANVGAGEGAVIEATSKFPASMTNVLVLNAGDGGAGTFWVVYITSTATPALPVTGLGESIWIRWYYNLIDCTNATTEHFFHVAGNSLSTGSSVWYMQQECVGDTTWGPEWHFQFGPAGNDGRNDFASSTSSLAQDSTYVFEVQLTRHATTDSSFYFQPYVYTMAGVEVMGPEDFAHGSEDLGEDGEFFTTHDLDVLLRSFATGVNGTEPGATPGEIFGHVGGVAICTTASCGLFNPAEEDF